MPGTVIGHRNRVQAWMEHKATLADATAAGVAVLSGSTVVDLVDSFRAGTSGTMSVRLTEPDFDRFWAHDAPPIAVTRCQIPT